MNDSACLDWKYETTNLTFSASPSTCYDASAAAEWPVFLDYPSIYTGPAIPNASDTVTFVAREKCEQPVVIRGYTDDSRWSIGSG
jgi:hypothetical protein